MTFEAFSKIWDEHYHPPVLTGPDVLVMEGSSQRTLDALIAYGQGDTSHFDRVREKLREIHPNRYPPLKNE